VRRKVRSGMQRRKHAACFRTRTYHRREIVESGFSRLKRTQGGFVKNRTCKAIRAELSLRFINDNLGLLARFFAKRYLFQQSPPPPLPLKSQFRYLFHMFRQRNRGAV